MPVELDGETYKRRVLPRRIRTAPKAATTAPARKSGGKGKLFVRTLTMADSEDILKAYKDYVVWNDDLRLYYLELPLTTGTVKIWFEDEKSLKAKAGLVRPMVWAALPSGAKALNRHIFGSVLQNMN